MNIKYRIIQKIPASIYVFLRGRGWRGNFGSWAEASNLTTGYDAPGILEKVKHSTLEAMSNHRKSSVSWELLSALTWIAAQNKGCLNIIDFGGALGKTCYHYKPFLDELEAVQWNVVEQSHFVELGKKEFENDTVKFYFSVDECMAQSQKTGQVQCVLFSSVLQYLEKPYQLLSNILKMKFEYIMIARTGFTKKNRPDRITVQKVHKSYHKESYPCRFFNESGFLNFFDQHGYNLVFDFVPDEQTNLPSIYKGHLFKLMK